MPPLTARALKCTVLLDPAEGVLRVQPRILADGRTVITDIAAGRVNDRIDWEKRRGHPEGEGVLGAAQGGMAGRLGC
jgi:hypothetical protein